MKRKRLIVRINVKNKCNNLFLRRISNCLLFIVNKCPDKTHHVLVSLWLFSETVLIHATLFFKNVFLLLYYICSGDNNPQWQFYRQYFDFYCRKCSSSELLLWKIHTGSRVIPPTWRRSQLHTAAVRQGACRLLR